jgi:hypothetical protein
MGIYKTVDIILPVVLYGFETWSFTLIEELQIEGVSKQVLSAVLKN